MAPQDAIDATNSHLQCLGPLTEWVCTLQCLGPLTEWVCALKHLVLTRLDLVATTLLKMLKALLMILKPLQTVLKTVVMVLKPLQTMEKPYMG